MIKSAISNPNLDSTKLSRTRPLVSTRLQVEVAREEEREEARAVKGQLEAVDLPYVFIRKLGDFFIVDLNADRHLTLWLRYFSCSCCRARHPHLAKVQKEEDPANLQKQAEVAPAVPTTPMRERPAARVVRRVVAALDLR